MSWRACSCRRFQLVVATAIAIATAAHVQAADKPAELRLSVAVGPAYAMGRAAAQWAKSFADRSEGRFKVTVVPGASIAGRDPARELAVLRDGGVDLAVGSSLLWSTEAPPLAVASLPWLAPSPEALAALARGDVARRLSDALAQTGVVPLAIAPLGHRVLATVHDPVLTPADLAGHPLRVPASALLQETYAQLGAKPRAMAGAAARHALGEGKLDGQDGTALAMSVARVDAQGIRSITVWDAFGELAVFAVSRTRWSALGEADRTLLRETAQAAADALPEAARSEREAALETLRTRGVAITRWHAGAHVPFADAVQSVVERWTPLLGADLVTAAREAVRSATP